MAGAKRARRGSETPTPAKRSRSSDFGEGGDTVTDSPASSKKARVDDNDDKSETGSMLNDLAEVLAEGEECDDVDNVPTDDDEAIYQGEEAYILGQQTIGVFWETKHYKCHFKQKRKPKPKRTIRYRGKKGVGCFLY